jgi:hypothetical protein
MALKDWEARLDALDEKLTDWLARYDAEVARLRRQARGGLLARFRRPSESELRAIADEARRKVGSEPLSELSDLLDELCDHFLESLPGERARVRARVGDHTAVFQLYWSYVEGTPERVRTADDEAALRRGLAAVAIDDLRARYDDVTAVLGQLWIQAVRAGLDPRPHFAAVAQLANKGAAGGGAHMREVMGDFEESHAFRAEVAPLLSPRGRRSA